MRAKNRVRVTSHSLTGFDVFLSVGTLKNRSFTAFGVSRSEIGIAGRNVSEIGIAGRNVTVTPWSGCDEYGHHLCKVRGTQLTQDKPDDKM